MSYYDVLGVSPLAEDVAIQGAYRALIRKYHPDANSTPSARHMAQRLNEAYAVLSNPAKRAEYDAALRAANTTATDTKLDEEILKAASRTPHPRPHLGARVLNGASTLVMGLIALLILGDVVFAVGQSLLKQHAASITTPGQPSASVPASGTPAAVETPRPVTSRKRHGDYSWGTKLLALPITQNWQAIGKSHCARDPASYQCRLFRSVDAAKPKDDFVHLGPVTIYKRGVCAVGAWSTSIGGMNFGTPFTLYMGADGIDDLRKGIDARPCGK